MIHFSLLFRTIIIRKLEDRQITFGMSSALRVLLVVHADHELDEKTLIIRIISGRKATASERRHYEESEE